MSATESPAEIVARLQAERIVEARSAGSSVIFCVTGGPDVEPTPGELRLFWRLFDDLGGRELRHGGKPGLDRRIEQEARRSRPEVPVLALLPNWKLWERRAGAVRYEELARLCAGLLAWPGDPLCVRIFEQARKPVVFIRERMRAEIERDHRDSALWG